MGMLITLPPGHPCNQGTALSWTLEYSSSSYAIGAGPKLLITYRIYDEQWLLTFSKWDSDLRGWSHYGLNASERAGCLRRWLSGNPNSAPDSRETIEAWSLDAAMEAAAYSHTLTGSEVEQKPNESRGVAGAPL